MARREYLSPDERTRFDTPPPLTPQQRAIFLDLPAWAQTYCQQILSPTNRVGFLLQAGYFRVVSRFFVIDRVEPADVVWICRQLEIGPETVALAEYATSQTVYRHRQVILDQLGYEAFSPLHRQTLLTEAARLTHLQTRPARMLDELTAFLRERRIEVPPYNTLREVLTQALDTFDAHLQTIMGLHLTPADRLMLDALLDNAAPGGSIEGRFPLTRLKHISQSMQPGQIAERVALFRQLKALFVPLAPLIVRLDLPDDTIRYYAQYVLDNSLPLDFLDMADRQHVFTEGGKLRLSLYKVLLFLATRDALRDGTLTVVSSYDYRSVDEYQIPRAQWQAHREAYLLRAQLTAYSRPAPTLMALNKLVNEQFRVTNSRLRTNPQVFFDTRGGWHLRRYRAEETERRRPSGTRMCGCCIPPAGLSPCGRY